MKARTIKNGIQAMHRALRISTGQVQQHKTDAANEKINMKDSNRLRCIALCCIRRLFMLLGAFLLGYFDCSIAWLLLITFIIVLLKDQNVQKKIRKVSVTSRETKETLEEKADWLNQAITQMWPHVLNHMSIKMRGEVETNIRATFDKYKLGGNFHFKRVSFGPSPLHLSCIEVLQESPPGEMVICADIVYESNCDVTFVWRGIKGGMKDFQMRGRAHLVLRPLMNTIPFISGYHIIFPEKPDVQYKLSGVGLFLDIPGLREIVNHIITKRISNLMSDNSSSEPDNGTDYQRLIETLGKQGETFDPKKYDNESSIINQTISNERENSIEKMQIPKIQNEAEHMDIKYKFIEEPVQENLSQSETVQENLLKPETPTQIPSTPSSVQEFVLRHGHASVSSECSSVRSDYNPIPKPSRKLPVNNN